MSDPRNPATRTLVDEAGRVVCERCEVTLSSFARMRGLLGRKGLPQGEGMLITHTGSVHTAFMAFPMDAVFLDKQLRVRRIVPAIPPWRAKWKPGSRSVLELAAGEAERVGIEVGSQLSWHDELSMRASDPDRDG